MVQTIVTPAPHVVHVAPATPPSVNMIPVVNDDMCRPFPPPSEDLGLYDRMNDFQEQFDKMQREMKALRGKEFFEQNVNDLCLVPNVKILAKFKVLKLDKYKGNTCPRAHLVMYIRRMSTHTDDQRLLIHFF